MEAKEKIRKNLQAPRKRWLAILLALFCPGLGPIYCGRLVPGLLIMVLPWVFFVLPLILLANLESSFFVWFVYGVGIASAIIYIGQLVWTWMLANQYREEYSLKSFNRPVVYLLLLTAKLAYGFVEPLNTYFAEAFTIPNGSMIPSLLPGDQIYAMKWFYTGELPKKGHVVVYKLPGNEEQLYLHRVVGLPGDTVEFRNNALYVNGVSVEQEVLEKQAFLNRGIHGEWFSFEGSIVAEKHNEIKSQIVQVQEFSNFDYGPITVQENHFFVLGDNRGLARDSRIMGDIPVENMVGRVHSVWWSWGRDGMRFERVGKLL